MNKIYIGADHRGFALKQKIKAYLVEKNIEVEDFGAHEYDAKDDYTTFAERVASMVAEKNGRKGILLCGSGVGVDVAANKFDGVRASVGINVSQVAAGRADDDMNILVIAADYVDENVAKKMTDKFLNTKFTGKARHKRRLEEIARLEKNN